jgi:hypothetical protein
MANELNLPYASGYTIFYTVRSAAGLVWYPTGEVMEAWGTGSRTAADYDGAMTDKSGGFYVGDMDSNVPAGDYTIIFHQQAGDAPVDTDYPLASQKGYWSGSAWFPSNPSSADIWDEVVESTITARQAMRAFLSVLTGKSAGGRTTTITFRDIGDTKNRITATVDSAGNRNTVVRSLT